MNKIHKNLTAIEQKFLSLKKDYQFMTNESISISQVAEIITFGVIKSTETSEYLNQVHNSLSAQAKNRINQKWFDLSLAEMIQFLEKVIECRNLNKTKQLHEKQKLASSPKRKTIKQSNSQAHQNPFVLAKILPLIQQSAIQDQKNSNKLIQNNQNDQSQIPAQEEIKLNEKQMEEKDLINLEPKEQQNDGTLCNQQGMLCLASNIQNLPAEDRSSILSKKYGQDKRILQKKFDLIYKHYRKEMYIPCESFQVNQSLLMDLRIFLKYYREFQISKNYRTNHAMNLFKKIALNGLWLDDKKFIQLHYQLIKLIDIEKELFKEVQTDNLIQIEKKNQLQKELLQKLKILAENIVKIKKLSAVLSNHKIKQIFNKNHSKVVLNKIVEVHSGLIKEDIMLKLQQRIEQRKIRKNIIFSPYSTEKNQNYLSTKHTLSPEDILYQIHKLSPQKPSIYEELQLPKLRSRQMKKSSIYSSLQFLNIQKQKQKLKQLINEKDNQKYLEVYFKNQKQYNNLPRSHSLDFTKNLQSNPSTPNFILKFSNSILDPTKNHLFQRNLSLPRMKFT